MEGGKRDFWRSKEQGIAHKSSIPSQPPYLCCNLVKHSQKPIPIGIITILVEVPLCQSTLSLTTVDIQQHHEYRQVYYSIQAKHSYSHSILKPLHSKPQPCLTGTPGRHTQCQNRQQTKI